jgi:hypothetical protein
MGSRSSSSTSSTNTQSTDTTQIGVSGLTDSLGVATESGDVEITQTFTDQGAIQGAVDIVGGGFDFLGEFASEQLDFSRDLASQSLGSVRSALDAQGEAIATVGSFTRSDNSELLRQIALYGTIAVAVIFGARFIFVRK